MKNLTTKNFSEFREIENQLKELGYFILSIYKPIDRYSEYYVGSGIDCLDYAKLHRYLERGIEFEKISVSSKDLNKIITITLPSDFKKLNASLIIEKFESKINTDKIYIDFAKKFSKLCGNGCTVYPTTYGIGVCTLLKSTLDYNREKYENKLSELGIDYTNEYSDAGWVYRFKISKSKENINRIEKLTI